MLADPAIAFLLRSDEPAIRRATLVELLETPLGDAAVRETSRNLLAGPLVAGLLAGMHPDASFGVHPYAKWSGAHWRLASLAELGVTTADEPRIADAFAPVLRWLGPAHRERVPVIDGLARRCGSQEGNALSVGVHLGLARDERVAALASSLVRWQWPDGGWNCDKRPGARHSSFNETWHASIGLARFATAADDGDARDAAQRGAEFVLRHRVLLSERTGLLVHPSMARLHHPPYWHYDLLAGLRVLAATGRLGDSRASGALDRLVAARRRDGTWQPGGRWWRRPGSHGTNVEVADWGSGPGAPLTLSVLRVLRAAGRWTASGGVRR